MPHFGERLRKQRLALGLSQQKFADACGIWLSEQQSYEEGRRNPNPEYLDALSRAGVDLAYLITGEVAPPMPKGLDMRTWAFLQNFSRCSPEAQLEMEAFLAEQARLNWGPHLPDMRPPKKAEVIDLARARNERKKS